MKCDYCNKETSFLEEFDHCRICLDCMNEIEDYENDSEVAFSSEDQDNKIFNWQNYIEPRNEEITGSD